MAKLYKLKTLSDSRGDLSVIQNELDCKINRFFYIYNAPAKTVRGRHGHIRNKLFLICPIGEILIKVNTRGQKSRYLLNKPNKCLYLDPQDWHEIHFIKKNSILMCLASHKYNAKDYFTQEPK